MPETALGREEKEWAVGDSAPESRTQRKEQGPEAEISGVIRAPARSAGKTNRAAGKPGARPACKAERRIREGVEGDGRAGSLLVFPQVALELAQLHLLLGQLDLCEQCCGPLLQTEQTHERAAVVGDARLHTHLPGALRPMRAAP